MLDFRLAGRAPDNRWNSAGERTLYLAADAGVALAEFARHFAVNETRAGGRLTVRRRLYAMRVTVDAVLDLRDPAVQHTLLLGDAPGCFLDKVVARSVAQFVRRVTPAQAILVPSMALLDDPTRWVAVLFLEKLPTDPAQFLINLQDVGTFAVEG